MPRRPETRHPSHLPPPEKPADQKRHRRHRPNFDKKAPKVWDPVKAKRCSLYPQSPELYDAWRQMLRERMLRQQTTGQMHRAGIRDGWGGKAKLARRLRKEAEDRAEVIVQKMKDNDVVSLDDERAETALKFAVTVIEDGTTDQKDRLAAARMVLDFTKQKPISKTQLAVTKPEDFLAMLVPKD